MLDKYTFNTHERIETNNGFMTFIENIYDMTIIEPKYHNLKSYATHDLHKLPFMG